MTNRFPKFLLVLTILVAIGVVIFSGVSGLKISLPASANLTEASKQEKAAELTDEQLKEMIGQMIFIGFRGTDVSGSSNMSKIITDVRVGGVSLSDYDVPSKSYPRNIKNTEQTKKLISDLQNYSATPLFVAVDAEGGTVNRLKEQYGFDAILSPQKMAADKTLETTKKESTKIAEELKSMGFNLNFAPVIDVNINPKNPIIGALGRSFSSDPKEVADNARVFIQSHLENNIITVEKHFPGHGSSTTDSHLGMVDITKTYKQEELVPYQTLNSEGLLNMVMTAHIVNKNIDPNYPATLSKKFLQGILREQIGFKGVIVSDDLQMSAISKNYGFEDAVVMAINAGCDMVYIFNNSSSGYDESVIYKTRDIIFDAVKNSKIEKERIIESYNRIIDLKKKFNIIKTPEEIKAQKFELIGLPDAINFNEALDNAKYVQSVTGIRPAFLLGVLHEELSLVKDYGLCYVTNFKNGDGKTLTGKVLARTINPQRDIPGLLAIAKDLGKDPSAILVTCPMSFGWGGAMGPADFIPSTWMRYKDKIEKLTGKPADPWNIQDAFLAAGLYLSDSGATSTDKKGEWNSAMLYFSTSINSPYTWYADGALAIANKIQADIDTVEGVR